MAAQFPTRYAEVVTALDRADLIFVLEIEGIPDAFSNRSVDGTSWYSAAGVGAEPARLEAKDRRLTVKPYAVLRDGKPQSPALSSTTLDFLGGRADVGTLSMEVADRDNSLVALTGVRRLADIRLHASVDETAVHWVVEGTDIAQLDGQTYAFIGTETVKITAFDSGSGEMTVERGQLETLARPHTGLVDAGGDPTGRRVGDLVLPWPRSLIDRRVTLRVGYNATADADCLSLFTGHLRSYGWSDVGAVLTFNCEDMQARMKRPLFRDLSMRWYPGSVSQLSIEAEIQTPPSSPRPYLYHLYERQAVGPARIVDIDLPDATSFFFIVGDGESSRAVHLLSTTDSNNHLAFMLLTEWWFAARPYAIADGDLIPARPMILITSVGDTLTVNPEWPTEVALSDGSTLLSDHVLAVALLVLCSTGEGTNGDFDALPFTEWGLGVPESLVDVDTFVQIARRHPDWRVRIPVIEPASDAREWLIKQLRPFGLILVSLADGRIGLASIEAPAPGETDGFTLGMGSIALQKGQPRKMLGPVSDGGQRATMIKWSDSPRLRNGSLGLKPPITGAVGEDADAYVAIEGEEPISVEAPGLYSVDVAAEVDSVSEKSTDRQTIFLQDRPTITGLEVMSRLLAALYTRFGGAPSVYTLECTIRQSRLSLGDWVAVTLNLPNPFTGMRGLAGVIAQVIRRAPNLLTGTIELDLSITDAGNERTRFLAPCLDVVSWNAGTLVATVEEHSFTVAPYSDTHPFVAGADGAGYMVRVYSADHLYRSQAVRVTVKDATHVTLSAAPVLVSQVDGSARPGSSAPGAGDEIELADYNEQIDAAKNRFSYFADSDGRLMNDPPHVYA
jgi:hypothetical protein